MIVRPFETGWEIYFHKAHALLAMDIGLAIDHYFWPVRKYLAAGLESIGEHDNDQPIWNKRDNLTEEGTPLDYRSRKKVDLDQAKSVVKSARYKSSFIAVMVSLHCQNLYRDSAESEVQAFLAEQQNMRTKYMDHLSITSEAIQQSYKFLRFCDDFSLALCQNELIEKKEIVINPIKGSQKIQVRATDKGLFTMDPWIFYEEKLVFPIEYYRTSQKYFKNDKELKMHLDLERPCRREFIFTKE
ncbi:DUF3891 family protein [Algoriphagus sp. D3-2-R+10]|uniref:DUF3891 family protein n=1 Tax=Algoriphagus aurantiacus TaxID=3103948 RepID=UPI002B3D44D5|nr:DUF3891 family protein [Algoriphagus sp. D3-2-R+10]MEB2778510.1 DUF3891 family protein [Algoriphagus sp. D3-2-R+10]